VSKLILTCGFPGTGKSTWAADQPHVITVSADEYRTQRIINPVMLFQAMRGRVRESLSRGQAVLVDACALTSHERMGWWRIAIEFRARAEIVVFTTPWGECRARDLKRGRLASSVNWSRVRTQMAAALREIPREGWDRLTYVPEPRHSAVVCWSKEGASDGSGGGGGAT